MSEEEHAEYKKNFFGMEDEEEDKDNDWHWKPKKYENEEEDDEKTILLHDFSKNPFDPQKEYDEEPP